MNHDTIRIQLFMGDHLGDYYVAFDGLAIG